MVNFSVDPSHIVRGPNKDVEKFPDTDIYSFMFHREEVGNFPPSQNPDRIAFIDAPSGQQITFRQLKNRIEVLSRGFQKALNLRAGHVVCFHMPNNVDPKAIGADFLDGLSNRSMGGSSAWCNSILCESDLHSS